MTRRRALFLIVALILIGGFIFREPILSACFQWYLKGYCRVCLGGRLTYEKANYADGRLVLENLVLASKKGLDDGGYRLAADRSVIHTDFIWFSRRINLSVALEEPFVEIGKSAEELKKKLKFSSRKLALIDVYTRFSVPHGTIVVQHFNHKETNPIYFNADIDWQVNREGRALLWYEDMLKGKQSLEIAFAEKGGQSPKIAFTFHHFNFAIFHRALKEIWPKFTPGEVSKGIADGKVVLTLLAHAHPFAEGEVDVHDFCFIHRSLECKLQIPKAVVHLTSADSEDLNSVQTIGKINILEKASLEFLSKEAAFWNVGDIQGSLTFETDSYAQFDIEGFCSTPFRQRQLRINGHGFFGEEGQNSFSIGAHLKDSNGEDETSVGFAARKQQGGWDFAELSLVELGMEEFSLVQHIANRLYSGWQRIHFYEGRLSANMRISLVNFALSEVRVESLTARNLKFYFKPWDLSGGVSKASGSLSFDLSSAIPLNTLNADLKIADGSVHFDGLERTKWQLDDIHTDLAIRKGVIQKSLLKGDIAGLKGEIILDGTSDSSQVSFEFAGSALDLTRILPDDLKKGIEKKFPEENLKIAAIASYYPEGLLFQGKLFVQKARAVQDEIAFGFALEKSSQGLWGKWPPDPFIIGYCSNADQEAQRAVIPVLARPVNELYGCLTKSKLGVGGFIVKDGWFKAENLALEQYISPFIFQQDQFSLSGIGSFQGTFDEQTVLVNYEAKNLVLDNSDLAVEVKEIGQGGFSATHVFDLDKKCTFGTFFVREGSYFEKNSGLLFADVNCQVALENDKAHLTNVETFCNGLYFAGAIDVDWSLPGAGIFKVDILAEQMHGKVSQVQHLFSHFKNSQFFFNFPIEGNIAFHRAGGAISFDFEPDDYHVQTHIEGVLTDGKLTCQGADVSLQELNTSFKYDHAENTLEFNDIQAVLLVGSPNHIEEYAVAGEHIRFTNYANNEAEFDLWVGDKKRDIVRLVGKTSSISSGEGENCVNFTLDHHLSHFGDVHPKSFELALKDWSQVKTFKLEFEFHLKTLLSDLQRFSRTGLLFLSRSVLKELNEIKVAEGSFKANFEYDGTRSRFSYNVVGVDIGIASHRIHKFLLFGNKKGSLWTIDQLQIDDISLAFDILREADVWNINFLGARIGKFLLVGLEGKYWPGKSHLEASINLIEANLAFLSEWPSLQRIVEDWHLDGQLKAIGFVNVLFGEGGRKPEVDIRLNGSLHGAKMKGLRLQDIDNMTFQYRSDKGFVFNDIHTALKSAKDDAFQAGLMLRQVGYDFINKELALDGMHFQIPSSNLMWLAENLQQSFPSVFIPYLADIVRQIKSHGETTGSLKLSLADSRFSCALALDDGTYQLMGKEHEVSRFILNYDSFGLACSCEYRIGAHSLWLEARTSSQGSDVGQLILTDISPEEYGIKKNSPLVLYWQIDPQHGYFINRIEGNLCGITCDLTRDTSRELSDRELYLAGSVELDFRLASTLMEPQLAAKLREWELGKGYRLQGQWTIAKDGEKSLTESLTFQGELFGRDFECLGYQFYNMSAQVKYSPLEVLLWQVSIADSCGNLQMNEVFFHEWRNAWKVEIPSIALSEFRPSLLRLARSAPPRIGKALVFRQLEIQGFSGILGARNSFKGTGHFVFANPPKKNLQHTIFAIPAEILARLGLDLAVLTPVRGVIDFQLQDGKILLKRFKDVYSKSRLSKFYLPNNGYQSYVDFDGNIHMQIRMKQYNLLFKLAELFTVTVQGTVKKPTYALQQNE